MATTDIGDENFREIYQNNDIIILGFWASWCGPCRRFSPIFEEVSEKYPEIIFGKVETEAEAKLSGYFGIRSIPTVIIIREKLEVYRSSGVLSSVDLQQLIEQVKSLDMEEVRKKIEEEERRQ